MALVLADRVQQLGTGVGTTSITLGATVASYQSFAVIGNGNTTYYSAYDSNSNWEVGIGTYSTTGPTLTRTTILASSNAGAAVTFLSTVVVLATYPASKSVNGDANGFVGIGTTAPTARLDVRAGGNNNVAQFYGTAGDNYILVSDNNGTNNAVFGSVGGGNYYLRTAGYGFFQAGGVERMRLTANGGVSWGASGTAYGSAGQYLQSNGDTPPTWVNPVAPNPQSLTFNQAGTGTTGTFSYNGSVAYTISYNSVGAASATGVGASGTWGINITGNAATATNATTAANAVTVGGFTPSQTAGAVNRVVVADGNGYIQNNYFNSTDNSVASGVTGVMVKSGDNYLRTGTAAAIAAFISGQNFNTTGTAQTANALNTANSYQGQSFVATATNSGQFYGIGNTASSSGTGLWVYNNASTTNNLGAIMAFHRGGAYAVNFGLDSDNVLRVGGWSAPANRMQLDMSGNMTCAGNITAFSDERLKKNWVYLDQDYVEKLSKVKAGTFERIDDDGLRQAGVGAQSLQAVLPEAVSEDNSGNLSVNYGAAAMVSVVELAKEIMCLRAEIAELKAKLA